MTETREAGFTPDLTSLLERVEKATGPDRKLDRAIAEHLDQPVAWSGDIEGLGSETYTASIDAALALVGQKLPAVFIELSGPRKYLNIPTPVPNHWRAVLEAAVVGWGETAPLAILAALLKALIAQQEAKDSTDGR